MNEEEQGHTLALDYHLNKTHIDETMPFTCDSYATCFASIMSCLNAINEGKSWSLDSSRQNKELTLEEQYCWFNCFSTLVPFCICL